MVFSFFFLFFFSPKRHFFFKTFPVKHTRLFDFSLLFSFSRVHAFADDNFLVKISAFAANPPPPPPPPSPFTKAKMTATTKTNDEKDESDMNGIKNTRAIGKKNVLKKETIHRLIKDVSRVDFAAPAPAYLENNLGQSNVRRYLLEPGPKDGSHSRCRIVRKKDAFGYCTYVLYADCPPPPNPPPPSSSMREGKDLFDENRNEEKNGRRCKSRFEARALCAARKRKKSRR